jgi:transcriptional regulator GlxA family with amidase domain
MGSVWTGYVEPLVYLVPHSMKIAILLFDSFTALDIVGPYEVLSKLPGAQIYLVGQEKRAYADKYGLKILADHSLEEIADADVLLIPGGPGIDSLLSNNEILNWIRKTDATTKWTTSVCSGSLLLAAAGLLENKQCTTHWKRKSQLNQFNVVIKNERYVHDGKIITSAGVSAGIDMALYLVSKIKGEDAARMIQLGIEYDPQPPFDSGLPDKVPKEMLQRLNQ